MENKKCCFLGAQIDNSLKKEVFEKISEETKKLIQNENVSVFYFGMEQGLELLLAEKILELKKEYPLTVNCVIPFEEQASLYSEKERELYFKIMENCDNEIMLSKKRDFSCIRKKDIYLIEKSDYIIAFPFKNSDYFSSLSPYLKDKKIIEI